MSIRSTFSFLLPLPFSNAEAERQACEIRLRAERKAGQLLKPKPGKRAKDIIPQGDNKRIPEGISGKQSANWQKLGRVPQAEFDGADRRSKMPRGHL
jgi:hypothetical protein